MAKFDGVELNDSYEMVIRFGSKDHQDRFIRQYLRQEGWVEPDNYRAARMFPTVELKVADVDEVQEIVEYVYGHFVGVKSTYVRGIRLSERKGRRRGGAG